MMAQPYGLIEYKHPSLELELRNETHPALRELLLALGDWCHRTGLKKPVLTCLNRSKEENDAVNGVKNSLHLVGCAADLRSWVWEEETDLPQIMTWLRGEMSKRGGKSDWEFLIHNAGSGKHLHVGRRDPFWRSPIPPKDVA